MRPWCPAGLTGARVTAQVAVEPIGGVTGADREAPHRVRHVGDVGRVAVADTLDDQLFQRTGTGVGPAQRLVPGVGAGRPVADTRAEVVRGHTGDVVITAL